MYIGWRKIIGNNLNVYGSKKMNIPEPEFYVIYTGRQKIDKDIISLRQDFWNNPDAKLDILARVIHSENKHDIIGQYIIFTHVLGKKKGAMEITERTCKRFGATVDETIKMLAEDFGLSAERAAKYVNKHWKESTLKKEED